MNKNVELKSHCIISCIEAGGLGDGLADETRTGRLLVGSSNVADDDDGYEPTGWNVRSASLVRFQTHIEVVANFLLPKLLPPHIRINNSNKFFTLKFAT